jgi:hypothetical protein
MASGVGARLDGIDSESPDDILTGRIMRKMLVPREFSNIPDLWHFAPVLDTGEFVFLSGITGVRPDGSVSDDPETQFRDTLRFVAMHLAGEAGTGLKHPA